MSGKVQMTIITVALALGGAGVQRAAQAVAVKPGVLYLAGQYKLMRGDTASALRLFQQAASAPRSARAQAQATLLNCYRQSGAMEL